MNTWSLCGLRTEATVCIDSAESAARRVLIPVRRSALYPVECTLDLAKKVWWSDYLYPGMGAAILLKGVESG